MALRADLDDGGAVHWLVKNLNQRYGYLRQKDWMADKMEKSLKKRFKECSTDHIINTKKKKLFDILSKKTTLKAIKNLQKTWNSFDEKKSAHGKIYDRETFNLLLPNNYTSRLVWSHIFLNSKILQFSICKTTIYQWHVKYWEKIENASKHPIYNNPKIIFYTTSSQDGNCNVVMQCAMTTRIEILGLQPQNPQNCE